MSLTVHFAESVIVVTQMVVAIFIGLVTKSVPTLPVVVPRFGIDDVVFNSTVNLATKRTILEFSGSDDNCDLQCVKNRATSSLEQTYQSSLNFTYLGRAPRHAVRRRRFRLSGPSGH